MKVKQFPIYERYLHFTFPEDLKKNINLYLGNHTITGKKTLFDWIEWLSYNFKINEIEFTISNKIDPKSINIIFDNFPNSIII